MKKILVLLTAAMLSTGCFNKDETATTDAANTNAAAPSDVAVQDAAVNPEAAPATPEQQTAPESAPATH